MMSSLNQLLNALEAQLGPTMMIGLLFGAATLLGLFLGACLMAIVAAGSRRRALAEEEDEHELLQNILNDTRLVNSRLSAENDSMQAKISGIDEQSTRQDKQIRHLNTELKAAQMSLEVKDKDLQSKEKELRVLVEAHEEALASSKDDSSDGSLNQSITEALARGRTLGLEQGKQEGIVQGKREGLEQGKQEGIAQGKREGLEQGKREGIAQGKREGLEQGKRAAAASAQANSQSLKSTALGATTAKVRKPPTLIRRVRDQEEGSSETAEVGIIPDDQIIPTLSEAELTANVEAYDLSDLEDLVNEDV